MLLRILNANVLACLFLSLVIRLSYFKTEYTYQTIINPDGSEHLETTEVPVKFTFVWMTVFVMPWLIALFFIMEFKIKPELFAKYFNFLDYPIGKGIFIIMMALIVIER